MRIICLEEHLSDAAIAAAAQPALSALAPYQPELARYRDDPTSVGHRPGLLAVEQAGPLIARPLDDARVAAMDAGGIDMQVVSYSTNTQLVPAAQAADLARAANDRLAAEIARYPTRFAGFCTLPWQDVDAAVREVDRCADTLGFAATMLSGAPGENVLVDDARYAPILARLEQRGMALYIHPGPPMRDVQRCYYAGLDPQVSGRLSLGGWGWHHEAGMQVIRLILSGALDRYPGLKIISGHWGEMVPFFLQRLDDMIPRDVTGLSRTITQTYRDQVWVTPSGLLYDAQFRFVYDVLGPARIMFAVDYPFLTLTGARDWLEALPIPDAERHAIAHGNAEALLRMAPL